MDKGESSLRYESMRIHADWPLQIQIRYTAPNQNLLSPVLWISIVLMPIQIRISIYPDPDIDPDWH